MKRWAKAILIITVICTVFVMAIAVYANDYYRAVDIDRYITDSSNVDFKKIRDGYFFDGPGDGNALIFYPGAKVEAISYAPVLKSLAENGVDCFLIEMPMNLAFFGSDKAENIVNEYSYEHYYLSGHSLGGAMAANYLSKHTDYFSGLFLLASYPTESLTDVNFPVVFIYGDKDSVLNKDNLEKGIALSPADCTQVVIKGGNHAQFGSYGTQNGDSKATVSADEQRKITVDTILQTVNG